MNCNSLGYRIMMTALAAIMMSFAWPLRGQFGHEWGAAITGGMAGSLGVLLIPSAVFRGAFAQAVFFGTLGFILGSENLPYGATVDYILQQPSLLSSIPQLLELLFIGASWGCVGSLYLGLGLSEKAVSFRDYIVISLSGIALIALTFFLDSKTEVIAIFTLLILFLFLYNARAVKSQTIQDMGIAGLLGFGFGFVGAVMILFWGNKGYLPGPPDWWTLRDQIWGGLGGLALALTAWKAFERKDAPVLLNSTGFQRFGFIFFTTGICAYNTWDVYQKWFKSSPPAPEPLVAAALLASGAAVLLAALFYFLAVPEAVFSGSKLNKTLLGTFLMFSLYLAFFAIAKSIVYSGWGVWETGFTLFVFNSVLFVFVMPFILLGSENS